MSGIRTYLRLAGGAALALLCTGCFTMQHELPAGSCFGTLPTSPGERVESFDVEASKNWFLAGLAPYTEFGVDDLVPQDEATRRIQRLGVETRFSELDVLISIVPGLAYGYYVWAPRTLRIQGEQVLAQ